MKKRALLILLCLALIILAVPQVVANSPIPSPNSQFYVLDQANVLDSGTEQSIIQTSAALQQETKAQIVVVTVNSLEGFAPEDYALSLLRQWGIGDKKLNNGVLILVSPNEQVSRIEVGYGLEGALPDAKTGRIQDEYMIPYFKQNDFTQGILNGYRAIAREVANEYQVTLDSQAPQKLPTPASLPVPGWAIIPLAIFLLFLFYLDNRYLNGFFLGLLLGMFMRGGGGNSGGGFGVGGGSGGGGGSSRRW